MSEENKVNGTEEQSEAIQADDKKQKPKLSKKERLDAELRGLSMKERKKVLEERKDKRRRTIYIIIGAVIALLVIALLFFLPIMAEYVRTGLVPRFPTLIACGFVAIAAIQAFFAGQILKTIGHKNRQDFELALLRAQKELEQLR